MKNRFESFSILKKAEISLNGEKIETAEGLEKVDKKGGLPETPETPETPEIVEIIEVETKKVLQEQEKEVDEEIETLPGEKKGVVKKLVEFVKKNKTFQAFLSGLLVGGLAALPVNGLFYYGIKAGIELLKKGDILKKQTA